MSRALLEICVDTPAGLEAAIRGGADRIELCSALDLGGLTPTPGLLLLAREAPVPVYAMIRPRAGTFVFDAAEERAMAAEIAAVAAAGLAGVVLGANRENDGALDEALLARLLAGAGSLGRTLHRAFDLVPDPRAGLETAVRLGFERVLTSGGERRAADALPLLADLVRAGEERVAVMPGSGVRPENAARILRETGAREIHSSGRAPLPGPADPRCVALGFALEGASDTSEREVRRLREAVDGG